MDFLYDVTGKIEEWNFFLCIPFLGVVFLFSSLGNLHIGIVSIIIGIFFTIFGMIETNHLFTGFFGTQWICMGGQSIIYRNRGIHTPREAWKDMVETAKGIKMPGWIQEHLFLLTILLGICSIFLILYGWKRVGKMLIILYVPVSCFVGLVVYFAFQNNKYGFFWGFLLTMIFFVFQARTSYINSHPYRKGCRILTLIKIPFCSIRYINGRDIFCCRYRNAKWKEQTLENKKMRVRKEMKGFAGCLDPGKYLIETHEAIIHVIENNLSPDVRISSSRKYRAIFQKKGDSEFEHLYGKNNTEVSKKGTVYVWYFVLENTQKQDW